MLQLEITKLTCYLYLIATPMAERLVVLSDMWGSRKGLWITSYLGYLQQYFDIVYHDSQVLADLQNVVKTPESLCEAFLKGGYDRAVSELLRKEQEESHYLTFCAGGTIAWSAALRGLPMKSLLAVSPLWMHEQSETPHVPVKLMYGEYMDNRPSEAWAEQMGVQMEVVPRFGRELYSDEKIIQQVCRELLERIIQKKHSLPVMKPLSVY